MGHCGLGAAEEEEPAHLRLGCSLHLSGVQTGNLPSLTQTPEEERLQLTAGSGNPVSVCVCVCACVHHAGSAPDVGRRSVLCSDQNLQSSVLPGLNVLGEVFVLVGGADRGGL